MVSKKSHNLSAKKVMSAKKLVHNTPADVKVSRIQQQIQTALSPKYTEMKTGARISRFGRPQTETKQDASSIPTEITKFIPKHSPKRLKPKDTELVANDPKVDNVEETSDGINGMKESSSASDESSTQLEDPTVEKPTHKGPEEEILKEPQGEVEGSGNESSESQNSVPVTEKQQQVPAADQEEVQYVSEESSINVYAQETLIDSGKETFEAHQDEESDVSLCEKGKHDFSDTDSALGSTVSCPETKDDAFFVGQILWGSFATHSWYPCIAFPFDDDGNITKTTGKQKQIHVKYFNWRGFKAFLPIKNVFEFNDIDHFWEEIRARGIKKSKVKTFPMSCYKAMEEANFFKQFNVVERMKNFEEIVHYQLTHQKSPKSPDFNVEKSTLRNVDRKSVDSAHESSASPPPSSPQHDAIKKSDLIESYLQAMLHYESIKNNNNNIETPRPKKVNKRSVTGADVEVIKTPIVTNLTNRRRSSRPVKKRTYDDFEQDSKSEADLVVPIESPAVEPKVKRAKVIQEETLEERFVIQTELLRHAFRNSRKRRVCMECFESDDGATYRCTGNGETKCSGWFHQKCSGHFETKREEIRHQCGDSDEIIQTQAMKTTLMCKTCYGSKRNCFICTKPVNFVESDETQHCPNQDCRLMFHSDCLKLWPQSKMSKGNNKRANQCPQHLCHTCFSKDIHNTGPLVKCMKCPAAYHTQISCVPAGTQILSQTQIICPRHPTEKELAKNNKEKNSKPLNIDWCTICSESGNLICCESCPNAFHSECIDNEDTDENYYCTECQEGRLPLYYTIVWARVGVYRWWPGLIMTSNVIPESTMKSRKHEREFCVRFFGSYDYFWFSCERVFPYDGSNISVKAGSSRLDSAFIVALDEARQFAGILAKNDPQASKAKPKPYIKLLQNRPVPPVKLKKMDEHTQGPCSCKKTDPSPCGKDSDCINMHLNFECNKASCPAGAACQNQKIRNREYMDLKIVKTADRGFGAISVKDVPEGTFVVEYVGELIDTTEFNKRMKEKLKNKEKEFYFLTIEADLYVDAEPAGNEARFINHSCDPNCTSRKVTVDGNTRIGIFTKQAIKAGTELTFDYQMEFVDNKKTACFCGAINCSGLIGEKPKEEKKLLDKGAGAKKKFKRKSSKAVLPQPKKRRTIEETVDPLASMMKKLPEKLGGSSKSKQQLDEPSTSFAKIEKELDEAYQKLTASSTEVKSEFLTRSSSVTEPETSESSFEESKEVISEVAQSEPSIDPFFKLLADTIV